MLLSTEWTTHQIAFSVTVLQMYRSVVLLSLAREAYFLWWTPVPAEAYKLISVENKLTVECSVRNRKSVSLLQGSGNVAYLSRDKKVCRSQRKMKNGVKS